MLNRGGWSVREKRWSKQSYLATSREDIREAHTILAYCLLTHCAHDQWCAQSSLPSFLSIEYNFNWCWHRTLHLKKKTFPIFENLLETSGTTTKVLSCLKIPLASMRVDRFASCENIIPSFKTSSILSPLPTPRTGLYIPLKKLFYSQCWRVLFQFLLSIMKGREMN